MWLRYYLLSICVLALSQVLNIYKGDCNVRDDWEGWSLVNVSRCSKLFFQYQDLPGDRLAIPKKLSTRHRTFAQVSALHVAH
jgi:hypothetical protein